MSNKEKVNQSDAPETIAESQSGAVNTTKKLLPIKMEDFLKSKGKFGYLPWAVVVKQLIIAYPDAYWRFFPHAVYPDGSMMVETSVTINNVTKSYILPVYTNYGGKPRAIQNPDAYAINTAYQRCLVKTIATFGLGLDIFTQDETDEMYVDVEEDEKIDMSIPQDKFAEQNVNGVMKKVTPKEKPKEGLQHVSPKGQEYWAYFAKEFINSCETEADLRDLWQANKPEIDKLKELNPEVYEMLVNAAKKVKQKIEENV